MVQRPTECLAFSSTRQIQAGDIADKSMLVNPPAHLAQLCPQIDPILYNLGLPIQQGQRDVEPPEAEPLEGVQQDPLRLLLHRAALIVEHRALHRILLGHDED